MDTVGRCSAGNRNVKLAMGEDGVREVDTNAVEALALSFVDCQGESWGNWELAAFEREGKVLDVVVHDDSWDEANGILERPGGDADE